MPQSPTPNMGLIRPSDKGDSDVWDSLLDACFGLIDQHDHTTGKGVAIPMSALNVNADFNLGNTHAIANALALDMALAAPASVSSYRNALYASSSDGELHWLTSAGADVKLTNGTSINASLIGGIGGDYASVGALLSFVDATDNYIFQQQIGSGARQYARVQMGDLDLFEYKASGTLPVPTTRVRHRSPASLASSYDVVWLAALPSAAQLMTIDNAGQVRADGVLGSNVNLQLQGTGYIKRASQTRTIPLTPGSMWQVNGGAPPAYKTPVPSPQLNFAATADVWCPLLLGSDKERLISVTVYARAFVGACTLALGFSGGIGSATESIGTATLSGSVTSISVPADGLYNGRTLTLLNPTQLNPGEIWYLHVTVPAGDNMDIIGVGITTDVP